MNLRLYSFTNYYLSSIQKGIQTAHVVHKLIHKYCLRDDVISSCNLHAQSNVVRTWAVSDRTIIVLNGGNCASLKSIVDFCLQFHHQFPWSAFHEDDASLYGALTAVGLILPESFYAHSSKELELNGVTGPVLALRRFMETCSLAV